MSYDTWKLRSDRDEYQCDCPRCSGSESDEDFWGGVEPPYEDPEPITLRPTLSEPLEELDDELPF